MTEPMKMIAKRAAVSFSISAFAGLAVNLAVDLAANAAGAEGFVAISEPFRALFPTPVTAAYVNVLLYGLIGAAFAGMTFIFQIDRLGFVLQFALYFLMSSAVLSVITVFLWQLHRYPQALIPTLGGHALTYLIMGVIEYRELKKDIREINDRLVTMQND